MSSKTSWDHNTLTRLPSLILKMQGGMIILCNQPFLTDIAYFVLIQEKKLVLLIKKEISCN